MNNEELVRDMTMKGSFDCSNHHLVQFKIPSGGKKASSRAQTWRFRTDFSLLKELVGGHQKQLLRAKELRKAGRSTHKCKYRDQLG